MDSSCLSIIGGLSIIGAAPRLHLRVHHRSACVSAKPQQEVAIKADYARKLLALRHSKEVEKARSDVHETLRSIHASRCLVQGVSGDVSREHSSVSARDRHGENCNGRSRFPLWQRNEVFLPLRNNVAG